MDLAKCVLKNNIFEHNLSLFKLLRGAAIGTMAPPYGIIFMGDLEEQNLQDYSFKPCILFKKIHNVQSGSAF